MVDRALCAPARTLALARRPLKFVTNWCFAPKGTEVLAHLVRSWTERHPRRGVIADDLSQMYQDVSRKSGFSFLRKRFPSMLGVFRFFYAISSVIWFGGAPVPVHVAADGSAKPAKVGDPGAVWLRSHDGGRQGCGGSTIFCVGGYHETLLELQRLHPDADIACTADDTYTGGSVDPSDADPSWQLWTPAANDVWDTPPPPQGTFGASDADASAPLFAAYADKRQLQWHECTLLSKLPKTNLYSREGDLSAAPPTLPGSPSHPTAFDRIKCFKVAGTFIGDAAACSSMLLTLIQARLAPLDNIARLVDSDGVRNVQQIRVLLQRLCASAIFNHWGRTMPPAVTAAAALWSDDRVRCAFSAAISADDSPADRRRLALACSRLTVRDGGLQLSAYGPDDTVGTPAACAPRFVSSYGT